MGSWIALLNRSHAALHRSVARALRGAEGWLFAPEVSFSVYGERGTIDILAFHAASGCLVVIELKTAIVEVNDLVATMDRRCRLAPGISRDRGWHATCCALLSRMTAAARERGCAGPRGPSAACRSGPFANPSSA